MRQRCKFIASACFTTSLIASTTKPGCSVGISCPAFGTRMYFPLGVSWPRLGTATATASSRAGQDRITENLEADCLFCILDCLAVCFLHNHTARLTVDLEIIVA